MRLIVLPAAISVLTVGAAATHAQDRLLPPTYQIGKEYVFETDQRIDQDMTAVGAAWGVPGMGKTTTAMMIEITARCEKGAEAGQRTVRNTISRMKMDVNQSGMQTTYDSTEPGSEDTPFGQHAGMLVGKEFTMVLNENGEFASMEANELLAGVPASQVFGADELKQMFNPMHQLGIPVEGISLGESWDNDTDLDLGSELGKVKASFKLKYDRDEEVQGCQCAVVDYSGHVTMDPQTPDEPGAPAMEMRIEDSEIRGEMKLDKSLGFFRTGMTETKVTMVMVNPDDPSQGLKIPMVIRQVYELKSVEDL